MSIFKTKAFLRFAHAENIDDEILVEAIQRAERGLVDADLGSGLIKQRVARRGQGRRGGYRMMIAFRSGDLAVFLFGFAKSAQGNLDERELSVLRRIAASWLSVDSATIESAVERGEIIEVPK